MNEQNQPEKIQTSRRQFLGTAAATVAAGAFRRISVPLPASSSIAGPPGATWLTVAGGAWVGATACGAAGAAAGGGDDGDAGSGDDGTGAWALLAETNCINADAAIRPPNQRDITSPGVIAAARPKLLSSVHPAGS